MTTKVTSSTLANTTVSAGNYGGASQIPTFIVDAQGRLIQAGNTTPSIANTQITGKIIDSQLAINNLSYTGTVTGGTNTVNIGSGQIYKDSAGNVGIGTSSPGAKLDINGTLNVNGDSSFTSTSAVLLSKGTTAERPSGVAGKIRFNTTLTQFEGYNGTSWGTIGGGATGGGSDQVFYENGKTVTTSYSITAGKCASSTGPITINSGVTVTIPSGSRWVIL